MKVYTKVVIDMATMETEYEESYEYEGDVALCKGGGGGTTKVEGEVDKEYNRRMAAIAERQQDMADTMFGYYQDHGLSYDVAQVQAQEGLIPYQTDYARREMEVGQQGLDVRSDYFTAMQNQGLPQLQAQAQGQFLQDAQGGIDIRGRMGMAQADVAKGFQGALGQQRLADSRMGLNPASGASMSRAQDLAINQAGAMAGARTQSRVGAEQEQFGRRQAAAGLGLGV